MRNMVGWVISIGLLFGVVGCGVAPSASPMASEANASVNNTTTSVANTTTLSNTVTNKVSTEKTNSTSNVTKAAIDTQPKHNVNSRDTSSLSSVVPLIKEWESNAEQIKLTINGSLPAFDALPSDDYGTSAFVGDYNTVANEYKTVRQLAELLDKQSANIQVSIYSSPTLRQDKVTDDIAKRVGSFDQDCDQAVGQIYKELSGENSIINQFKSGATSISGPVWTFTDWNNISNDESAQWQAFIVDYESLLAQ